MSDLTLKDLEKRCGDYLEMDDDTTLCECGNRRKEACTGVTGHCYLMPTVPDERWPSAETRWWLGY